MIGEPLLVIEPLILNEPVVIIDPDILNEPESVGMFYVFLLLI
jgi:hypothetical protein